MKLFIQYLKQRWKIYIVLLLFSLIFIVSFLLFHLPAEAISYPFLVCFSIGIALTVIDFFHVKKAHDILSNIIGITDAIENTPPKAESITDEDYQEIIKLLKDEHISFCNIRDKDLSDMVDYYTVWVHQIKTPIASMRLKLQNEDSPLSRQLSSDLCRIEQYVEMVLTFLRLNSESSDYVIKEYDIDSIIKSAIKKFSYEFIDRKLKLEYEPICTTVITDEKWLCFVVEQILSNALKYTQSGCITISLHQDKKLSIKDTGTGIAPEDLPRIFENGYTGFNGRTDKRASGIGLYLCHRICNNLGHNIKIESILDEGTTVTIDLSQKNTVLE